MASKKNLIVVLGDIHGNTELIKIDENVLL
jgi:hypothetical protein